LHFRRHRDLFRLDGAIILTTSDNFWSSAGLGFSTTSADYWKTVRDFFATSSATYFTSLGLAFSTTSANAWSTVGSLLHHVGQPLENDAVVQHLPFHKQRHDLIADARRGDDDRNTLCNGVNDARHHLSARAFKLQLGRVECAHVECGSLRLQHHLRDGIVLPVHSHLQLQRDCDSTSTPIWFKQGVQASSTSYFDQLTVGSTTVGLMATSTFNGNVNVVGAASSALYYAGNGSAAAPAYTFGSRPNQGIYSVGANQLGLAAAGALQLQINSNQVQILSGGTAASPSLLLVDRPALSTRYQHGWVHNLWH